MLAENLIYVGFALSEILDSVMFRIPSNRNCSNSLSYRIEDIAYSALITLLKKNH